MRHKQYVVPQCRPQVSSGLQCVLQLRCNWVIWKRIIRRNTEQTAFGDPKTTQHIFQMYSRPCSSMFALELSSLISFRHRKRTGDRPDRTRGEPHTIPNFYSYSKCWPTLWIFCSLISIHSKLNKLCFVTGIASKLHQRSGHIPYDKCWSRLLRTAALDHNIRPHMTIVARYLI